MLGTLNVSESLDNNGFLTEFVVAVLQQVFGSGK